MIARLEVEMMLTAMIERVASIEITANPDRLRHNTLRAVTKLPVRMVRSDKSNSQRKHPGYRRRGHLSRLPRTGVGSLNNPGRIQ